MNRRGLIRGVMFWLGVVLIALPFTGFIDEAGTTNLFIAGGAFIIAAGLWKLLRVFSNADKERIR